MFLIFSPSRFIIPLLFLLLLAHSLYSQMPEWSFFKDREGNEYYYDGAFNIVITDERDFNYPPVSAEGIDFYYNSGLIHAGEGDIPRALYFFKSILALNNSGSNRIRKIQVDSVRQINMLNSRHGTRMAVYDNASTLLLVREGDSFRLINEKLYYRFSLPLRPEIIREGWKRDRPGYGMQFGVRIRDRDEGGGFDLIGGIETIILPFAAETADRGEEIFKVNLGPESFIRDQVFNRGDSKAYRFRYPGDSPFQGYEAVFVNGNYIHLLRLVFHDSKAESAEKLSLEILEAFHVVR